MRLTDQELVRRYRKSNARQQRAVAEIITAFAAKGPAAVRNEIQVGGTDPTPEINEVTTTGDE